MERSGPSTDMQAFRELFAKARNIVALSGAGISAESGVPTFRLDGQKLLCELDDTMTVYAHVQRSGRLLEEISSHTASHARSVCRESLLGLGVLPLPQRIDGHQTPQCCS